jgi:hydroxyacylglutathione hydrolase
VAATDEDEFVRMVLADQPEPPRYFAEMKRTNKAGPRVLGGLPRPPRLPGTALEELLRKGEVVVDTRAAAEYAVGHVPGTLNIPLNGSFTTWAGWLLPYGRDVYLLVDDVGGSRGVDSAVRDLSLIGLDRVAGIVGRDALQAWSATGRALATVTQTTPVEAAEMLARGEATAVDVRGRAEWEAGHVPGVPNIPVGYLAERLDELPTDRPVIVHCQGGARSAIAASVLQACGLTHVVNVIGGYAAWEQAGLPTTRADARPAAADEPALATVP